MNKCLVVLFIILGLISCTKKNERYYQLHPNELQEAVKACPGQQRNISCQDLQRIAMQVNVLAYQLQMSPQGFGNKILSLQETLAKQREQVQMKGVNAELKASIAQTERQLEEYLAIVKWLESPVS